MTFQEEMKQLGERTGEHAITESIVAAYDALMESEAGETDNVPEIVLPDSKVYVSADGSQVLGLTWGDDPNNVDPDPDLGDDDPESNLGQGYDCYTYADIYDVDDGFDLSQLPSNPWDLDSLEGKGLSLAANLEQRLYRMSDLPTEEDALGVYVNPDEGWKAVTK